MVEIKFDDIRVGDIFFFAPREGVSRLYVISDKDDVFGDVTMYCYSNSRWSYGGVHSDLSFNWRSRWLFFIGNCRVSVDEMSEFRVTVLRTTR